MVEKQQYNVGLLCAKLCIDLTIYICIEDRTDI